jgi:hypothetical protein
MLLERCALTPLFFAENSYVYLFANSRVHPWLQEDMDFFGPPNGFEFLANHSNFFLVNPEQSKGVQCRVAQRGTISQAHFDENHNMVAVVQGSKRYVLLHPSQCGEIYLRPRAHPSGRHSMVNWTAVDETQFPLFAGARGTDVLLQEGEILYLPPRWIHFVVSLEDQTLQCNARSGGSNLFLPFMERCGFSRSGGDKSAAAVQIETEESCAEVLAVGTRKMREAREQGEEKGERQRP